VNQSNTLLFIGAHPDDETFGPGGTLAHYAMSGVRVYYICATRGEAGIASPEHMQGFESAGDMRWAELECAARELGLAGVFHLGYRDSGMLGTADNAHPQALMAAPAEQVAERMLEIMRRINSQVIVTHDPLGGYRHPDHIAVHNAVMRAFSVAHNDCRPQKLYFTIFPRGTLRLMVRLMPLLGQDPHRFGRNKDIDLASLVEVNYPVHAVVKLNRQAVERRDRATVCYRSQTGGRRSGIFKCADKLLGQRDLFMRAYPPANDRLNEKDLFDGVVLGTLDAHR
jgi:N-acetyl-1-D-myo-inositol-2-amino-2-deoxy-alpha-D-glucopyranoside deacetylase